MKAWVFFFSLIAAGLVLAAYINGENINDKKNKGNDSAAATEEPRGDEENQKFYSCPEAAETVDGCLKITSQRADELSTYYVCVGGETSLDKCAEFSVGELKATSVPQGGSAPTPTSNENDGGTTASKGGVDCPTTNSDWLGMVTSELGSDGYLMSNTVHNDDFDFIRVKLTNSWELPSGWSSNIDGATMLEAGEVYSIYPPFACQGHIG